MKNIHLNLTLVVRDHASVLRLLADLADNPGLQILHYEGCPQPFDADSMVGWEEEDYGGVVITPAAGTPEGDITPADIEQAEKHLDEVAEFEVIQTTPTAPVTLADAIATAKELNTQVNTAALVKLLATFGVKRVSDLEESQYSAFVEAAERQYAT